jgi:hypothetical protein
MAQYGSLKEPGTFLNQHRSQWRDKTSVAPYGACHFSLTFPSTYEDVNGLNWQFPH